MTSSDVNDRSCNAPCILLQPDDVPAWYRKSVHTDDTADASEPGLSQRKRQDAIDMIGQYSVAPMESKLFKDIQQLILDEAYRRKWVDCVFYGKQVLLDSGLRPSVMQINK